MFVFLIQYPHIIIATVWVVFALALGWIYFRTSFGAHVVRLPFVVIALTIHLIYAALLSWGQYVVWSGNEFTRAFLNNPLSPEVSFSPLLTTVFSGNLGYFWFYVLSHFFAPIFWVLCASFVAWSVLSLYKHYHPLRFKEGDISIILASLLIAGWPGVLVLIPAALMGSVVWSLVAKYYFDIERVYLPPSFIVLTLPAFFWGAAILRFF